MSHFSACVVIPKCKKIEHIEERLAAIMAPYDEASENPEYLEFRDRTEEAKEEYNTATVRVVQYPDNSLRNAYDREFMKQFFISEDKIYARSESAGRELIVTPESEALTLIADYPASQWYGSFEKFCEDHLGYKQNADGCWGTYSNPNAQWDWYEIGGRFPGKFMVHDNLKDCIRVSASDVEDALIPDGYRFVNAARKKDICWAAMRTLAKDAITKDYERLATAFQTGDTSKLGILEKITDEGIIGWGYTAYYKDETLEQFLERNGATDRDTYPIHTFAVIDRNGEWFSSGESGWFGLSHNDKPEREWNDEIQELLEQTDDNDYLVCVDIHI